MRKARLAFAVMFSTLLLSSLYLGIVQTSGAEAGSWVGANSAIDESDVFFNDSYIHDIYLYFDDPNWYNTLYEAHDSNPEDPYFPARFVSHGIEINPIGVRFKGLSTFGFGSRFPWGGGEEDEDIKKPFRLDFNMYDEEGAQETTFLGLKKLNLNNGALDPTMMREKLFMDYASKYVPTPRSVYTRLYVNEEYYGFYLAMEHIDNTFVESRFGNNQEGNIYKVDKLGPLTYNGSDPANYINYEIKNNDETKDYTDLVELTDILTNTPSSQIPEKLEPIFDVEQALYSIALLDLFVNLDSYIGNGRNYYLYDRSDNGQITHLLWDANLAFGNFGFGFAMGEDRAEYAVFPPTTIQGFGFFPGRGVTTNLTMIESLMAIESYNRTYLRMLAQLLREGFSVESMTDRVQKLADLIRYEITSSPNMQTEPSVFEQALNETIDFVRRRAIFLNTQLDRFARNTDLQFNDLMTFNQGTIVDDSGDYDPWVEIYNLGPGLINTSNLFLTDDPENPNKWQLPDQNIEDGEFLLLWLDGEPDEGDNHASFGVNSSGGDLRLYADEGSDYVLIDTILYPQLDSNVSFSRFPDGKGSWLITSEIITPAEPNQLVTIIADLFINEFMANNDAAVQGPDGDYPDWIELYNSGTEIINLTGLYLSDDLSNPQWQFPADTYLEPGGFIVVWADNAVHSSPLYADFNLNAQGEFICLLADDAETIIDSVAFGQQSDDISYGRRPDGASSWSFLTPTPNLSNTLGTIVTPDSPTAIIEIPNGLFINEFMANNDAAVQGPDGDYPDWIELYNSGTETIDLGGLYLSDDLANPNAWQFPSGTIIEPNNFLVIWADSAPERGLLHASFSLNATGEDIGLFAYDGESLIDSIAFTEQISDVSYGRLPDGDPNWNFLTPTPGLANELGEIVTPNSDNYFGGVPDGLFINELMADNQITIAGPNGTYPDWIELFNASNETINLSGMYLTDDLTDPTAWRFPNNTFIEAGRYLLIWADNSSDRDGLHASFRLNANGEAVGLFASDGETQIDSVTFLKQIGDVSYGRLPDGGSNWEYLLRATPGWGNNKRPDDPETSVWLVLLLIGLAIGLSALVVIAGKLHAKSKR